MKHEERKLQKLKKQTEESLQKQVADYLRIQYPNVLFRSDGGGLRMPIGLSKKFASVQKGRAWPDLFIAQNKIMPVEIEVAEHSMIVKTYYGMFLELKRPDTILIRPKDATKITKGETKLRKKGDWYNDHIEEQANVLAQLRQRGYKAEFAVGFDEAKKLIDDYLK